MDIRQLLLTVIETSLPYLSGVDKVKSFPSTDEALKDAEKIVFNNSAFAIGDVQSEKNVFSKAYDKNTYTVTILYFVKSVSVDCESNITALKNILRGSDLGNPHITYGHISFTSTLRQLTERVSYYELTYNALEIEPVN